MKLVTIPSRYNYIAVFLTLACNIKCPYCINKNGKRMALEGDRLNSNQWSIALNRIVTRPDLPISLQGGEPTIHSEFYEIVNSIRPETNIDLLTNGQFSVSDFCNKISPEKMKREAPYASIRFSYHPMNMNVHHLINKVTLMQDKGYSVGIWCVDFPSPQVRQAIQYAKELCEASGIDFRIKEFLGEYNGKIYGTYKYNNIKSKLVDCRTSELIIGPNGNVYRCHADLYDSMMPVGNLLDEGFEIEDEFRCCSRFGACSACDIKIKTNRMQQYGHTSVEIEEGKSEE